MDKSKSSCCGGCCGRQRYKAKTDSKQLMKLKIFSRKADFWKGVIVTDPLQEEVNRWLDAHPSVRVVEVKHNVSGGFWSWGQFIVSIYYSDTDEKTA